MIPPKAQMTTTADMRFVQPTFTAAVETSIIIWTTPIKASQNIYYLTRVPCSGSLWINEHSILEDNQYYCTFINETDGVDMLQRIKYLRYEFNEQYSYITVFESLYLLVSELKRLLTTNEISAILVTKGLRLYYVELIENDKLALAQNLHGNEFILYQPLLPQFVMHNVLHDIHMILPDSRYEGSHQFNLKYDPTMIILKWIHSKTN
jgi:hypothetical protein